MEKSYEIDLGDVKKLLPPVETQETKLLTPTEIANNLKQNSQIDHTLITPRKINSYLNLMELQVKTETGWELTETGKQYGFMYPYERNGHSGFQLKWKPEVVNMIVDYLIKG